MNPTSRKPNLLFLMTDQMQGQVLQDGHPCRTPHLDRLAREGVRFANAYTPNPVCSPARASLMTGLLPHNHGVRRVVHTEGPDQNRIHAEHLHWAQGLQAAGYRTGYFGKWHVDHADNPRPFGWDEADTQPFKNDSAPLEYRLAHRSHVPEGYRPLLCYGVTETPPEERYMGQVTRRALGFLETVGAEEAPWCCFVSFREPHDPLVCGHEAWSLYDVDALELPPNADDPMTDKPGLYRKARRVWQELTDRQRKEAMACYYASITELDHQFGRLLEHLRTTGELENTWVVLTSDHGELLGAHGLYAKNIGAFEETYRIPLVMSGPGIRKGVVSTARVGLHDLHPTLLELAGCPTHPVPDSRSFVPVLAEAGHESEYDIGYAEYFGGRIDLTQRVVWEGEWKFIFNGFDEDELYHLASDPFERVNLATDPAAQPHLRRLCARMWEKVAATRDSSLHQSHYGPLRLAPFGPGIASAS